MKAAVAHRGHIGVEKVTEPVPGSGQVLVATLACGICGTDLHLLKSQESMPDLIPAMVLGHEFVGQVLDYGPDTNRRFAPGSIVTSVPYLDTSDGPQLVGLSATAPGALAERMLLQETRLLPVDGGAQVAPQLAAFAEPLAVGVHAVGAADMDRADVALVMGCGPVGLCVIAALKASGFGPVVASDFSPKRRSLAEQLGADVIVDPAADSPYTAWTQLAGPALPSSPLMAGPQRAGSVIFECVGLPGMLAAITESAPPHTRIVVAGVCMQPDTFTPMIATTKELSIRYVFAYRPDEFATALRWITEGVIDISPCITATIALDEVAKAFTALENPDEHAKILITPPQTTGTR